MTSTLPQVQPFYVKNCSLASLATGERASSLQELRDKIAIIDEGSIYHHFWGGRMNPQFIHPQNHNDFASWVYHKLHDHILAERLSIIDPTEYENMEALRQELLEVIERRLDETESIFWTKREDRFNFISSSIIVFESTLALNQPSDLAKVISELSPSSIFYHFIDARVRTAEGRDDFSLWLEKFDGNYEVLIKKIRAVDPYFLSLTQLRDELAYTIKTYFSDGGTNV